MAKTRVAVIGAGLGGLSAAISLAAKGFQVEIFEKNDRIGGKLNLLEKDGFRFDLGPSIFTLPQYFESLFARAGKRLGDYVPLVAVRPHWRNFFEDGTRFDLDPDDAVQAREFSKLAPGTWDDFRRFRAYSKAQYDLVAEGYFDRGIDGLRGLLSHYGPRRLFLGMDSLRSMDRSVRRFFRDPKAVDAFNYFIKYIGSSANQAPGFMNLMPWIQYGYDLWYIPGGLYGLARGLGKLAGELGIPLHLNAPVKRLDREGRRISGLVLEDGREIKADLFVSNMEILPARRDLLGEDGAKLGKVGWMKPACSGLVIHLGTDRIYPQLAHHNFFYSKDQKKHFDRVFRRGLLPDDPTLYVVAPTRTDPGQAPAGCDNLKILPHIPPIDPKNPLMHADYAALKDRVIDKLERMGLPDLRRHIILEDFWTPLDIEARYRSNRGSIYGVVSELGSNWGFKGSKRSGDLANLYFTGGSVNPGAGMPMVVLCGQKVADAITEDGFRAGA
ncbi:MAG: phytoene desaturase [Spirochaetes bacterium]|nr:phytoene desaturase [Spirochaetota bacterium]